MSAVETAVAWVNTVGNYERVLRSLNTISINIQSEYAEN